MKILICDQLNEKVYHQSARTQAGKKLKRRMTVQNRLGRNHENVISSSEKYINFI